MDGCCLESCFEGVGFFTCLYFLGAWISLCNIRIKGKHTHWGKPSWYIQRAVFLMVGTEEGFWRKWCWSWALKERGEFFSRCHFVGWVGSRLLENKQTLWNILLSNELNPRISIGLLPIMGYYRFETWLWGINWKEKGGELIDMNSGPFPDFGLEKDRIMWVQNYRFEIGHTLAQLLASMALDNLLVLCKPWCSCL